MENVKQKFCIARTDYYASGSIGPTTKIWYNIDSWEEAMDYISDLAEEAKSNNANFSIIHEDSTMLITMDLTPVVTGHVVSKFTIEAVRVETEDLSRG